VIRGRSDGIQIFPLDDGCRGVSTSLFTLADPSSYRPMSRVSRR